MASMAKLRAEVKKLAGLGATLNESAQVAVQVFQAGYHDTMRIHEASNQPWHLATHMVWGIPNLCRTHQKAAFVNMSV